MRSSPSQKGCMGGKGVRQEPFDFDFRKKSWKFGLGGGILELRI